MKKAFVTPFVVIVISGIIGGYFLFANKINKNKNQVTQSENLRKLSLKIEGMSCIGCKKSVESSLRGMKGVLKTNINQQTDSGIIIYNSQETSKKKIAGNSIFNVYTATIEKDQKYKK